MYMKETCEFRILEEFCGLLFTKDEGKRLGDSVKKIVIGTDDPRFPKIGTINSDLRKRHEFFFAGWQIHRKYKREELDAAVLFQMKVTAIFEPSGEMCDTIYDEAAACPECGAGAVQKNELRLDFRRIPRGKDIAATIANEVIISQRLAEILTDEGIAGFSALRARHKARYEDDTLYFLKVPSGRLLLEKAARLGLTPEMGQFWVWLNRPEQTEVKSMAWQENAEMKEAQARKANKQWPVWHQLVIDSTPVRVAPKTRFGVDPFDQDENGRYRCPFGHVLGLNVLSELFIEKSDWDESDFTRTVEFVGARRGVLRPRNMILVSPKVRRLFIEHKIKGAEFEVAYLV
jgi:hypothetical protein